MRDRIIILWVVGLSFASRRTWRIGRFFAKNGIREPFSHEYHHGEGTEGFLLLRDVRLLHGCRGSSVFVVIILVVIIGQLRAPSVAGSCCTVIAASAVHQCLVLATQDKVAALLEDASGITRLSGTRALATSRSLPCHTELSRIMLVMAAADWGRGGHL